MSDPSKRPARRHLLRSAAAGTVAVVGLVVASTRTDRGLVTELGESPGTDEFVALGALLVFLVAGIVAVRALTHALRRAFEDHLGDARGAPLALTASVLGYVIFLLPALDVLGVNLRGLLLGGAITGVALGIAAQQTLGNFFAGIVLLIVRPFRVGEHIVLRSGPLGGEYEGTVTEIGLFYVDLGTERGPVALPNAGVLAAAIGPGARSAPPPEADEDRVPGDRGRA